MPEPTIYHDTDWPHGLMCERCPHVFIEGEAYCRVPEGFSGDTIVLSIVCPACDVAGDEDKHLRMLDADMDAYLERERARCKCEGLCVCGWDDE